MGLACQRPPPPIKPAHGLLLLLPLRAGRPGEEAIEVARLIERGLRESRAVDQEALVVISGRKVGGFLKGCRGVGLFGVASVAVAFRTSSASTFRGAFLT